MRNVLINLGNAMPTVTVKPKGYWKQNAQLLAQQARTMCNHDIARAHNATSRQVINQLHKLGIPSFIKPAQPEVRKAHLLELMQTHSVAQIAALEKRTDGALRQEMRKLGLQSPSPRPRVWDSRKDELALDAQTMTTKQLADKYGCQLSYMHCVLKRLGISAAKAPPKPKAAPKPRAKRAVAPKPVPRNPKPLLKATPSRASIASKAPAQIIWPAHVKVQHITLPPPKDNTRICTGSVRSPYRTGQGLTGYQAF